MPVYEYECQSCGAVKEEICPISHMEELDRNGGLPCHCGNKLIHIQTAGGQYCGNEDSGWLRDAKEVADKNSKDPATRAFIANPTRSNWKAWMASNRIRPLENGERTRPEERNIEKVLDYVMRKHQERVTDSEYRRYNEKYRKEKGRLRY